MRDSTWEADFTVVVDGHELTPEFHMEYDAPDLVLEVGLTPESLQALGYNIKDSVVVIDSVEVTLSGDMLSDHGVLDAELADDDDVVADAIDNLDDSDFFDLVENDLSKIEGYMKRGIKRDELEAMMKEQGLSTVQQGELSFESKLKPFKQFCNDTP